MGQSSETDRHLPAEWNNVVPTEVFLSEAANIVEKSRQAGVTLRAMGGVGIAMRCPGERDFARRLGRMTTTGGEFTDLDFAGLMKERNRIADFFRSINYGKRPVTLATSTSQRQIYFHPEGYFTVDVLLDKLLIANHPIDFRKRLGVDGVTLSLADLLLEKIQMWVSFSEKDLKDCLLLLKAYDIKDGSDADAINSRYIADLLSDDWGFCYTATTNLKKMDELVRNLDATGKDANIDPANVTHEERELISSRIERLLKAIDDHPKSMGWRMREKLGTKKQWYNHVETSSTVGDFGLWRLRDPKAS